MRKRFAQGLPIPATVDAFDEEFMESVTDFSVSSSLISNVLRAGLRLDEVASIPGYRELVKKIITGLKDVELDIVRVMDVLTPE